MNTFQKGATAELTYPLTSTQGVTGVASPKVGNAHGIARPTFPGEDGFDRELQEVADVRMHVLNGVYPVDFLARHATRSGFDAGIITEPLRRQGLSTGNPRACANIVHMDAPSDLGEVLLDWLRPQRPELKAPDTQAINFLNLVPDFLRLLNALTADALHKAFEVKYFYGRPRPEEVFMGGECPPQIYTHYTEGCPKHPAYPAGHGAAAGATLVAFDQHFVLTDAQLDVIKDSCYLWAMYRTFAGVHYANDNLEGLRVGGYFDV